jgi:hypothetical protein
LWPCSCWRHLQRVAMCSSRIAAGVAGGAVL